MLSRFPDPYKVAFFDVRLATDADVVPSDVLVAYGVEDAVVTRLDTHSFNIHFRVESKWGVFDLRRSNRPFDRGNLLYEAELLSHLRSNSFDLVPEIVPLNDGSPNYWSGEDGWTLFKWIQTGENGVESELFVVRIEEAARTLAAFHSASAGFAPKSKRGDLPIFAKPEDWNGRWAARSAELSALLGDDEGNFGNLAAQAADEIEAVDFASLATFGCHADYRLRNLRFTGDRVSTVFDMDTSLVSTRLLDLGGAATRFSPDGTDPQPNVESGSRFLRAYDDVSPLTEYEWQVLPVFIRWRLIRDVTIYYDQWWLKVGDAGRRLFADAADRMVERARSALT